MNHDYKNKFDMSLLNGKIVMAFTDPLDTLMENYSKDTGEDNYKYFTDDFTGEGVHTYYVFDTMEEFIAKWKEIHDKPNGMWYWCLDNGICFCSGAVDPDDIEIFEEQKYMKNHMYKKLKDHIGHKIACVAYGDINNPADICIECEDCNCVLVSTENFED